MSVERKSPTRETGNSVINFLKNHGLSISIFFLYAGAAVSSIALASTAPEETSNFLPENPHNRRMIDIAVGGLTTTLVSGTVIVLINNRK